jgi:hypothetical protein
MTYFLFWPMILAYQTIMAAALVKGDFVSL